MGRRHLTALLAFARNTTPAIYAAAAVTSRRREKSAASRSRYDRIQRLVLSAIPIGKEDLGAVGTAVFSGIIDINPADPVEGMLVSQLVVAHEAALAMYRKAWVQDNFEIKAKYLALADKTQRTVVMLTERLEIRNNDSGFVKSARPRPLKPKRANTHRRACLSHGGGIAPLVCPAQLQAPRRMSALSGRTDIARAATSE